MSNAETNATVPTCLDIGKELVESADVDSLDGLAGLVALETEEDTVVLEDELSDEDWRIVGIREKLRSGNGIKAKLFGVIVEVKPSDKTDTLPFSDPEPDGGDREPRTPINPLSSSSVSLKR